MGCWETGPKKGKGRKGKKKGKGKGSLGSGLGPMGKRKREEGEKERDTLGWEKWAAAGRTNVWASSVLGQPSLVCYLAPMLLFDPILFLFFFFSSLFFVLIQFLFFFSSHLFILQIPTKQTKIILNS